MRTIDLEALKIFRAVVDEGGVIRAATKLNRVQSSVTTRIRQLEQHLGTVTAQRVEKKADVGKELQKKREAGDCKVTLAGFVGDALGGSLTDAIIEAQCPHTQQPIFGTIPKDREQAMLSVALIAISTGKQVIFSVNNKNEVGSIILVAK